MNWQINTWLQKSYDNRGFQKSGTVHRNIPYYFHLIQASVIQSAKDTDCILSYFDFKLGEIGINPKPCPITDDEGETVAYDYPPDYYFLEEYVNDMVSKMEFEVYPEEAEKAITDAFEKYAHKYYTVKNIEWFQDYSIEKVIEKSKVSEKWRVDFDLMEQRKRTFMNLSIAKKVIKILQG